MENSLHKFIVKTCAVTMLLLSLNSWSLTASTATAIEGNVSTETIKTTALSPTFGSISQAAGVCHGDAATFNITGLLPNTTSTLTYNIDSGPSMYVANVISDGAGNGWTNIILSAVDNGKTLTVTAIQRTDVLGQVVSVSSGNTATLDCNYMVWYYMDADSDGYGNPNTAIYTCAPAPAGYVTNGNDCNDANAAANPGNPEVLYNGVDDNCDGMLDEGNTLTTHVKAAVCGTTLAHIYSSIHAHSVPNATAYRFKVTNVNIGHVQYIESPNPWFGLPHLPAYDFGTEYSVAVEIQLNGTWLGYFGSACSVWTPALPAPTVNNCGSTLPNIYSAVITPVVPGATGYRFRVTNLSNPVGPYAVQTIDRNVSWFNLTMLTSHEYGILYSIEVAIKTPPNNFSAYGPPCQISTPSIAAFPVGIHQCGEVYTNILSPINANVIPFATAYRFRVTNLSDLSVQVIDPPQSWINFSNFSNFAYSTNYNIEVAIKTTEDFSAYGPACMITSPAAPPPPRSSSDLSETGIMVVHPNPYSDSFSLELSDKAGQIAVGVYDMSGKLLELREVQAADVGSQRLGSNLPPGIYNVIITQGEIVKSLKVVKK